MFTLDDLDETQRDAVAEAPEGSDGRDRPRPARSRAVAGVAVVAVAAVAAVGASAEDELTEDAARGPGAVPARAAPAPIDLEEDADEDEEEIAPPPRTPRANAFGSVWDSQIGTPTSAAASKAPLAPLPDEDDLDEPEIPEYLIAEQRRGAAGRAPVGRAVALEAVAPRTSRRWSASDTVVAAVAAASTATRT